MRSNMFGAAVLVCAAWALGGAHGAQAAVLWDNGGFVTNPTGGTGTIAGQPISSPELVPNSSVPSRTTGISATAEFGIRVAEDFTVPAGSTWNLDALRVFGFQQSLTGPTVTAVKINLWTSAPFDALSPAPRPSPLPQPVLAQSLTAAVTSSELVAYRQLSTGTTSSTRAVYGYDVSLDGLPNGGELAAGTYWLEWSMVGVVNSSQSQTQVVVPLVTPRESAPGLNARQFAPANINGDGVLVTTWFESREVRFQLETQPNGSQAHVGYFDQPMALPFVLGGSSVVIPEPAAMGLMAGAALLLLGRRRG